MYKSIYNHFVISDIENVTINDHIRHPSATFEGRSPIHEKGHAKIFLMKIWLRSTDFRSIDRGTATGV